jgi:hypothetical protein
MADVIEVPIVEIPNPNNTNKTTQNPSASETKTQKKKKKTHSPNISRIRFKNIGGATNVGTRYLDLNQDYFVFEEVSIERSNSLPPLNEESKEASLLKFHILGVLDGHNLLGEVASKVAGEEIVKHLKGVRERRITYH